MKLYIKKLGDISLIIYLLILSLIGIILIYSANGIEGEVSIFCTKQIIGFFSGILIIYFLSSMEYKTIMAWGSLIHYLILLLLILTLIKGSTAMGGRRWIGLGFFKIQPSELAKITLPLCIIHYYISNIINKPKFNDWIKLIGIVFFTALIIIKQPDLGSGLIILSSGMILLFVCGLPRYIIYFMLSSALILAPLLWTVLHEYQKKRIMVFLGHGSVQKERYQLEQSKIAIGSGGFLGKGFLKGTQKNLKFLPENRTDFIFSVLAEELGFLGVTAVIFIYILIIFRFLIKFIFIDEINAFLLCFGLVLPFIISVIFNIGMVVGLLPVVGIPLPCISYGLSHLWGTFITIGIINSVLRRSE